MPCDLPFFAVCMLRFRLDTMRSPQHRVKIAGTMVSGGIRSTDSMLPAQPDFNLIKLTHVWRGETFILLQ